MVLQGVEEVGGWDLGAGVILTMKQACCSLASVV